MYISLYYSYIVAAVMALPTFVMSFPFVRTVHVYGPLTSLHMLNENGNANIDQISFIQKYKPFFDKEPYNNFIQDVLNDNMKSVFIDKGYKQAVGIDNFQERFNEMIMNDQYYVQNGNQMQNTCDIYSHYHLVDIQPMVVQGIVEKSAEHNVPVYFVDFSYLHIFDNILNTLGALINYAFPVAALITFLGVMNMASNSVNMSQMRGRRGGSGSGSGGSGGSGSGNKNPNPFGFPPMTQRRGDRDDDLFAKPNVSLSSWAGSPEVIEECKEVISYIEQQELYAKIGAEMPRGILLEGPPGTGKTLLAKAIATETNSTFISMSGSEFVELFVGMGAARVRELFDEARDNSPCIIFIDEIDAVGRQRGTGVNMANDEREQTLNQLLYEMDGFNNNTGIVVLAATNRRDVLDQALLRPGRFDRVVRIPLPDKDSRNKILEYYVQTKRTAQNLNISVIAEMTDGFSGAELKNLVNEAAILSVRQNYTEIQERFVFDALEKLIVGLVKQNSSVPEATRMRVSVHESGHSVLALLFPEDFEFKKASVQPTYNGAGGYTIFTEKPEVREGGLYTKALLKKRLAIMMGGKAAETIFYGSENVSLGAIEDLRQANKLAKQMIGNFGMGKELEVFFNEDVGDDSNPFLGRSLAMGDKYSEHTKTISDKESLELVNDAYETAKNLLLANYDKFTALTWQLMNTTVVTRDQIEW